MLKQFYHTVLLMAFFMLSFTSQAQNSMHEIGVRVSPSLTNLNPSFIYKKQLGENLYKRYNWGIAHLSLNQNSNKATYGSFNTALSIGKEKRRDISKRLKFINGLQYAGGVSFSRNDYVTQSAQSAAVSSTQTQFGGNVGLSYLLGIHFELSPAFYINLETLPGGNVSYQSNSVKGPNVITNTFNTWGLNADYSNGVVINVVYCFSKK